MRGEGWHGYPQTKRDEFFALLGLGYTKTLAAAEAGISRATGHRWINELKAERVSAKQDTARLGPA